MERRALKRLLTVGALATAVACDGKSPTQPSPATSFLVGTWRGTITVQPRDQPATSSSTTWTFEVVPQTNQQNFRATIRSDHPWLPSTIDGTAAVAPSATPPTTISTTGEYSSPRGCRGTFGSIGPAEATRIETDFHGVDCEGMTFDGRVILTKSAN